MTDLRVAESEGMATPMATGSAMRVITLKAPTVRDR